MFLCCFNGFIFVELLIMVVVIVILLVIVYLSFQGVMCLNWIVIVSSEVFGLIVFVCSEVICNKCGGGVCGSVIGISCDGSWDKGMLVWVDVDGGGMFSDGEVVFCFMVVNMVVSVVGFDVVVIVFDGCGCCCSVDQQEIDLQLDSCNGQLLCCCLMVNVFGQFSIFKENCL